MQYLRNVDLTKLYPVNEATVRGWIDRARQGKLDLTLTEQDGRTYIANTAKNLATMERLVEERKKFVNTRGHKVVTPLPHFYEQYTHEQMLDIITNLTAHREIPLKYNYFDGGAETWDEYTLRILEEGVPSTLQSTIDLLNTNLDSLDRLLAGRRKVNVIDLGVGNALPGKGLLAHLLDRGLLHRYIAVDISAEMLEIARRNVQDWFGGKVPFEAHVRDIGYDKFKDLVVDDFLKEDPGTLSNLVLFLGGTLSNFRTPDDVLRVIHTGMMPGDLLLHSLKLDSPHSRLHFDFSGKPGGGPSEEKTKSKQLGTHVLTQLGIDDSCYELEAHFDEQLEARFIQARLKIALTIRFTFGDTVRQVELSKGEAILLHRVWHRNALDVVGLFARNGFDLLQASQTSDHEYLLTVSDIRLD